MSETAGTINRWGTSEWIAEPLATLTDVTAIRTSPSGKMLAVASLTDGVGIYDTTDWTENKLLSEPKDLTCLDWAPHGEWIAGGDTHGKFWTFAVDGTQRKRVYDGNNRQSAITSIAVGWDGDVIICAGLDGRLAKFIKLPVQRQPAHESDD